MKRCKRCILPDTFPGAFFDRDGICKFCRDQPSQKEAILERNKLKEEMELVFNQFKTGSDYHCIVAFSGGKDSSYTLWLLAEVYQLNCLAVMIDNGYIAEEAIQNGKNLTAALGVDFHLLRPSPKFMKGVVKKSLQGGVHSKLALRRASEVCNSCISLINHQMLRLAIQMDIPMIAGGYITGQVPKSSAVMKLDLKVKQKFSENSTRQMVKHFGEESRRYYSLPDLKEHHREFVYLINPILTVDYSEEMVYEVIEKYDWKQPENTGKNSSNCLLNDLGIKAHQKQQGYNPYVFEIAEMVRNAQMSREEALAKVEGALNEEQNRTILKDLQLKEEDL